jgi:thiol-disulfide isomerase/thioredoxin
VQAARENKKPLLVNFWATWCGPCRYEFPELVKIDAEYRARGLEFAVVSLDNLGAIDYPVADFLRVYRSTMPSYLLDLPAPVQTDRAIRRIAPRSRGGLPLTLLFNAKGKLVYQKTGVIDPQILRAKIGTVLTSKARAENVK